MKIVVKEKKYILKFGFRALAKSGVLEEVAKLNDMFNDTDMEDDNNVTMLKKMPELFESIGKIVLAGLQKFNEEYIVDYDNEDSVKAGLDKVYDLLDLYMEEDEHMDVMELFSKLTGELFDNGFLSNKTPQQEQRLTELNATVIPMDHVKSMD